MALKDYRGLRRILDEIREWPQVYMFKFIVPNQYGKVDKVVSLLPETGKVSFNHTRSLHYVAVTCQAEMYHPDDIVKITQEATAIEGVLAL